MKSQTGISRYCSKMVVVVVNRDPGANLTSEQYGNYATYAWGGRGEALNFHNFRPGAQGSPIRICSRALTLRKLDHEPLLDAGMLLCGSLLELMAVGHIASTWRDSKRRTPKERKDKRTRKRKYDKNRNDRCDSCLEYVSIRGLRGGEKR